MLCAGLPALTRTWLEWPHAVQFQLCTFAAAGRLAWALDRLLHAARLPRHVTGLQHFPGTEQLLPTKGSARRRARPGT